MYVSRMAGGLLAAGLAFLCGAGTATAQQLYEQTPSGPTWNYGYLSTTTSPYSYPTLAADSFQLTEPALLSRVSWWGFYEGVPPDPMFESFAIRIHADDGGKPGAILATYQSGAYTTRAATGRSVSFPDWNPQPRDEYAYKWSLPSPFPLEANTTYWISVVNVTMMDATPWYWSHSAYPNNVGMTVGNGYPETVQWVLEEWKPFDPNIALANLAFRLDSFAPPSYATYEQTRVNEVGGAEAFSTEWADSFVMTGASTIKRIVWWGGLRNAPGTMWVPNNFTLRIYADDAGEPGAVLATYAAGDVFWWDHNGDTWLEHWTAGDPYSGIYSTRFEYVLPTPFAVQANTRYWLGIVNDTTDQNWLWQAGDGAHELGVRFRDNTVPDSPWVTYTTPPLNDLAFRIETAPLPVFDQRPTHTGGMGTLAYQWTVADPFQLTQTTDITRISWWGYYGNSQYYPPPGSDNFTVHIFADNGGQPGAVIATYTPGDQVFRTLTGDKAEYEWPQFPAAAEYFFSMALPATLTLQANTTYWISINAAEHPYVQFMWGANDYTATPGALSSFTDPLTGPWVAYSTRSMAFRLDR